MKRTLAIMLAGVLCLVFAGSAAAGGHAMRPFGGTMTGDVTTEGPTACPLEFTTITDATGTMLHLGRTTAHWEHCLTPPNLLVGGSITFTAANGDKLFATYEGSVDPAMPENVDDVLVAAFSGTITGGTGRFTGASGWFTGHGYITFPGWEADAWPGRWDMHGVVTY